MIAQRQELEAAITDFRKASNNLEAIRHSIALQMCPLKVGETVQYTSGGKVWKGVVNGIHYSPKVRSFGLPDVDEEPGWSVDGLKIRKGDGKTGTASFSICMFEMELKNGIWEPIPHVFSRWRLDEEEGEQAAT